ncbi:SusC/RagA family TonB-linked outer membrane protein [Dyadobacter psychrotolerans]|uniref:SusC/RagA family TonB-linked outer membrane protein n=2 Tax=Dyadobacter psychrotolerans TaxID=2541721 RepID=A0A4R5DP64_9BACT|nr:SusC/RagA family TonB-linked outer membrane protein [Dyadobacter psychrotolerans]
MRITIMQLMLSAAFCGITLARETRAQELLNKEISLRIESSEVKSILSQIEKQANVRFVYSTNSIQARKKVSFSATNSKLSDVLDKLLNPLDISYEIEGTRILLQRKLNETIVKAPEVDKTISGKVVDDKGEALPGVSIVVKGTQQGTSTDIDGKYQLSIPDGSSTLIFSFVGYISTEKTVTNETVIDITLATDTKSLQEIVVVGYGTQKRANVTAAISSVPMSEIKDMPVSNVATALQGKIPGVVIQQNNGTPGSTPAIKVRGFGSISAGNSPLIVVDGNIVNANIFSTLNTNDIESMDVLKDASSTAIYGSKGSNGVILITTKRGKSGKPSVNLDVFTGFQQVSKKIDLINSQQFAEFGKDASNNAYLDNIKGANITDANSVRPTDYLRYRYPRGEVFEWLNFDDPAKVAALPYTDYQDEIFKTAKMNSYQLSASGGTDKARYSISGGYLQQDGIIRRSALDRYTLRANVEVNILPKLKIGMNLNPSYKIQQEVKDAGHWADNAVINSALSVMPFIPIYAADGSYTSQTAFAAPYNYPGITNPVANITEYNSQYLTTNLLGNTYAELNLFKDFTYRVSGNINFTGNRRNAYRTSKMPLNQILPPSVSTGTAYSDQSLSWLFNQTLNYSKSLNDIHNFDVLIGMESTKFQYQDSQGTGSSYPNDVVETLNGSASGTTTTSVSSKTENASASYFARANYNYKGKYLVNVSVRRDGSSIFGPDNRWGTFPAGSLGWRVSEETFMKSIAAISEAKLRISYGLSGNNAFNNNYPYVATLRSDNYSFNNGLVNGLAPSSLANSQLGWERSQQLDAGIDLGFFSNRILVIVDYYQRTTKDLLLSVNVPTVTGFSTAVKNIGRMENKGWEFGVNTRNLTKAVIWNTSLNLSFNRNKVVALGPTGDPIRSASGVGETNITQIGSPIGSFYGYKQLGIFKDQADLDSYPHDATSKPGDVKYEDINGDKIINANDRTIIGNNQPDFIYGVTNTFSYKGFDLNIAIQGTQGGEILNLSRRFFENLEGNANQLSTVLTRWRSASDPGDGVTPRANARTTGNNNAISTRWVEDGSYLRIQNVSLGYQLPASLVSKAKLQQVRIYASAQNLFTFTKYLNFNPEVSNYEGPLTGGVDYGVYPLAKTFTIGVNIGL